MYNRQPKKCHFVFSVWWEMVGNGGKMVGKWWEFLPKHTKTLFEGDLWTT